MRLVSLLLLAAVLSPSFAQQKVTAGGAFVGRSGKPMAKARLILAEIKGDDEVTYARIILPAQLPTATADASGAFQFTGIAPGEYTILYQPTGGAGATVEELQELAKRSGYPIDLRRRQPAGGQSRARVR